MMKRIFSSAVMVLLIALAGCGNKEETKAATSTKNRASSSISDAELKRLRQEEEAAIRALENLLNEASENDQFAWLDEVEAAEDAFAAGDDFMPDVDTERAILAEAVGMGPDELGLDDEFEMALGEDDDFGWEDDAAFGA